MPVVSDYFKESPFRVYAGKLSFETGTEDFVPLKMHDDLRRATENSILSKSVAIRLVVSGPGGGKTWTLSWLARYFSNFKDTWAIAVPRLELRGRPERGLVEAIFLGLKSQIKELRVKISSSIEAKNLLPRDLLQTPTEYVWWALMDPDAYAVLCGSGGAMPVINGMKGPQLTKTEGTLQLLTGLFRVLYFLGYVRVIVLIDEVESLFVAYGRRDLFIFEDYIRNIIDEFQSDQGRFLPRVAMVLAGTEYVLRQISPALVGKQTDRSDIAQSLIRRLESPFALQAPDRLDALRIANHRIGAHRMKALSAPYIPFDEDAILYIWDNTLGIIGDFCQKLQETYELALEQKAQKITLDHAKQVLPQPIELTNPTGN